MRDVTSVNNIKDTKVKTNDASQEVYINSGSVLMNLQSSSLQMSIRKKLCRWNMCIGFYMKTAQYGNK